VDVKNLPPHVAGPIMQAALFEAALIMRELGFPPPLPVQPQPQQSPTTRDEPTPAPICEVVFEC